MRRPRKSKTSKFPFIEGCLFNYKGNCARLIVKREDLERARRSASVQAQQYDSPTVATAGGHGDPVFSHVALIDKLEREVAELERCTQPITRLYNDMIESTRGNPMSPHAELKELLEKRYFAHCAKDNLDLSEWVYRKLRKDLVALVATYMGL